MNDKDNLAEEIFCLNYELNTLANVLLRNESERWVPGFLHEKTEHSHTTRYKLACKYTAGKSVIDIACGVGKGSKLMATVGAAGHVSGFDIQPDAIRYANWRNGGDHISFAVKDAEALGILNEYDIAVSFETVEHLPNYHNFFASIKNCLKPNGLFLISTPISAMPVDTRPANPYHVQEWGFGEFQQILKEFFDIEKVYVQLYPQLPANTPKQKTGILNRVYRKIKHQFLAGKSNAAAINESQDTGSGLSTIVEYTGQYPVNQFGVTLIGYQIVLAKVKAV